MKSTKEKYAVVGDITRDVATLGDFGYTGKVYMSPGVKKHIIKKHGKDLGKHVIDDLGDHITKILQTPDYIGVHPDKKGNTLELVKRIGQNLLVAIAVDLDEEYLYVASLYPITRSKLENRVYSGRFKSLRA